MALRLEIISAHRQQLGSRARFVLGDSGASIGRALDNDWALPDVSRFLSSHHAHIHYRAGEYFLEDTSSNGTFVNESVAPLGRRGTRALLHPGDVIRMGEYRILVHLDEHTQPAATPDAQTQADMTVQRVSPVREVRGGRRVESAGAIDFSALVRTADASSTLRGMALAPQAQDGDLGDALNIESLLPDAGVALRAGYSGTTARPDGSTVTQNYAENAGDADSTQARVAEQERIARLRSAARSRLEGTSSLMALDPRGALDAFCRGAGIDAGRLPVQDEMQALQLAGRLLREALLGLKEVLRAQQAFVDSNGIERQAPEGRSPLDANMDEYLVELMLGHEKRKLDAVMRLRDQFAHASAHAAAIDPALRSALSQFLGHLAPDRLATGQDGAANWNRYKDVYGNLLTSKDGRLPHLFLEALGLAYQDARGKDAD
jgi:type VI secretion system FHA domain protein